MKSTPACFDTKTPKQGCFEGSESLSHGQQETDNQLNANEIHGLDNLRSWTNGDASLTKRWLADICNGRSWPLAT